jgi:hypothetical protein
MLKLQPFYLFLLCVFCCNRASAEENLALQRGYTLSPKPNYAGCTDASDNFQLTDGKVSGSDWGDKSTVGWRIGSSIPEITIDLGKPVFIERVKVHSVGGGSAGVYWPDFMIVLVGNDGKSFKCAGLSGERDPGQYINRRHDVPRVLEAKNLEAQGRFVKVILRPGGPYVFLDEVEVIGNALSPTYHPASRTNLPLFENTKELFDLAENQVQLRENLNKATEFANEQQKLQGQSWKKFCSDLELLGNRVSATADKILLRQEQSEFQRELGLLKSRIYQEIYKKPYVCIPANPMEILCESAMNYEGEPNSQIDITLWEGEFESAAVNVISCSDKPIRLFAAISPLIVPDAVGFDSEKVFTIRRGVFVKACRSGSIADALVLQNKPFELMPGEVAQMWLTVHNPDFKAGSYKTSLAVSASLSDDSKLPQTIIPIHIQVEPIAFPRDVSLNVCTWAYPKQSGITNKYLPGAAKDLSEHYTNVFVVRSELPFPTRISDTGEVMAIMSYEHLDELMRINSYAKTFLFFYGFQSERKDSGIFGKRWMSDQWKKTFSSWLIEWVKHLRDAGIEYDRFAMYPFDESLCDEFYELAKLIKSTDPKIKIYANSFGNGPSDYRRFKDIVDIWCLCESFYSSHPDWLAEIKSFGKEVWTYEAKGPGKTNHPYSYYRLIPWKAFKDELTGVGFWVYADPYDTVPWDDTARAMGYYGVVYGGSESPVNTGGEIIIPSRRWEAWREGIEDYVYLQQLQEAIEKLRRTDPTRANQYQQFIANQVEEVLRNPRDCRLVYKARHEISHILVQLKK